jgi:hypothetical protein
MKLFPGKTVTVKLRYDRATTLNELRRNTKLTNLLGSYYTSKEFIGQVSDSGFKLVSSEIGRGAFCVFIGDLQDSFGELEIRLHKGFRIMTSILMVFPFIVFGIATVEEGIGNSITLVPATILAFLAIRFFILEMPFRRISKTGMNKLKEVAGLEIVE